MTLAEELAALATAQQRTGPRYATPRADPFDAVRKEPPPSGPAGRAPFERRAIDPEAGYRRSPEAVVAGGGPRPAVVVDRPAVTSPQSTTLKTLLEGLPQAELERLLAWAEARHYTAAQLLAACRAVQ